MAETFSYPAEMDRYFQVNRVKNAVSKIHFVARTSSTEVNEGKIGNSGPWH